MNKEWINSDISFLANLLTEFVLIVGNMLKLLNVVKNIDHTTLTTRLVYLQY